MDLLGHLSVIGWLAPFWIERRWGRGALRALLMAAAQAAAGEKRVTVMGGASVGQQFIAAGLVDEIQIHLVPVLFGAGTQMFDHLGGEHIQLEPTEMIDTPTATHLRFRIAG
jgi:dihydrofolate reductase